MIPYFPRNQTKQEESEPVVNLAANPVVECLARISSQANRIFETTLQKETLDQELGPAGPTRSGSEYFVCLCLLSLNRLREKTENERERERERERVRNG